MINARYLFILTLKNKATQLLSGDVLRYNLVAHCAFLVCAVRQTHSALHQPRWLPWRATRTLGV